MPFIRPSLAGTGRRVSHGKVLLLTFTLLKKKTTTTIKCMLSIKYEKELMKVKM